MDCRSRAIANSRTTTLVAFLWVLPVSVFAYFSIVKPWPLAEQALAHLGPGPKLVVGMSYQVSLSGASNSRHRTQAYLAFPDSLRTMNAYEVIQDGAEVRVDTIPFGLFIFGSLYGVWIGASIWYVLHRKPRPANAPNEI